MKRVWGERPSLPAGVLRDVARRARGLGRQVAGDDLFLLVLTELPPDAPCRRALAAEGIDADHVLEHIKTGADEGSRWDGGISFAPAFYTMLGRAEAFAAVLGDGRITNEHVLLALLWDPMSATSQLLWRMRASREGVVSRLRAAAVPVPETTLPSQREIEQGERVWVGREEVAAVLAYVGRHLPPGTVWGFNYEGQQAWLVAESHVDLPTLVATALRSEEARP
jgi:Clp amino terminal domain, pathogenicity island component